MGLKKRSAPEMRGTVYDTVWIGDENADLSASDINKWCATADPEFVKAVEGKKLAKIRYRALTEREEGMLPRGTPDEPKVERMCCEAARYGIVSIDGVALARSRIDRVLGLADSTLDELCEHKEPMPLSLAFRSWSSALGTDESDEPTKDQLDHVSVSLPVWLGVHILAATFRARRSRS